MDSNCDRKISDSSQFSGRDSKTNQDAKSSESQETNAHGEQYWKAKYDQLQKDFDHLQRVNQNLEEKLLNVVETFERKREELVANVEYEKSTLMANVNKLSTKLVDARIKLHDLEEQEILHAAECSAPCHKVPTSASTSSRSSTISQAVPLNKPTAPTNGLSSSLRTSLRYSNRIDPQQVEQKANDPNLIYYLPKLHQALTLITTLEPDWQSFNQDFIL